MTLLTVGHGTLTAEALVGVLRAGDVALVVDVRSYPGSRRHPQFAREAMEAWVPEAGIAYRWERRLGGRRRPAPDSPHVALRNEGFRGYADHMETEAFRVALDEVLHEPSRTAVLCSESVWWRCHRRLLADHLVLVRGVEVVHLMHDGRLTPHAPTQGVRLADGGLVYDVGATPPLPTG